MCDHEGREHRTSPCHLCRAEAAVVDMPQVWEGDQA